MDDDLPLYVQELKERIAFLEERAEQQQVSIADLESQVADMAETQAQQLLADADVAESIIANPDFKEIFCNTYRDRNIQALLDIPEIFARLRLVPLVPVMAVALVVLWLAKKGLDYYCKENSID
jgi:hypothetical protein